MIRNENKGTPRESVIPPVVNPEMSQDSGVAESKKNGIPPTTSPLEWSEIPEIVTLLREYFPVYQEENLRRLFSNPDAQRLDSDGTVPCAFILRDNGKPVGSLCSVRREVFHGPVPFLACINGSVYVRREARDYLATLILTVYDQAGYDLHLANTSNQDGAKITRVLRFVFGPKSCSRTTYRILSKSRFLTFATGKIPIFRSLPLFLRRAFAFCASVPWRFFVGRSDGKLPPPRTKFHPRRIDRITPEIFDLFWTDLLAGNRGLLTSRRTDVYRWTFQDGLDAGRNLMTGLFDDSDRLRGCLVLRIFEDGPLRRMMITDWVAVGNDEAVLGDLLREAVLMAEKAGGFLLESIGFSDSVQPLLRCYLPRTRRNPSNSFSMKFKDRELHRRATDMAEAGWFFGPYDGDRAWN